MRELRVQDLTVPLSTFNFSKLTFFSLYKILYNRTLERIKGE